MTTATASLTEHWHELVTVALLGTDRREPPAPPPGALADVVDDAVAPTASVRMLTAVAGCVAARRAGLRPLPPAPPLAPPERDERPLLPAAAARRWRESIPAWPVLEDEWLAVAERRGWRLPPDVLVGLLRRHRTDALRRARVLRMGGAAAAWLLELQPQLRSTSKRRPPPGIDDPLPALAVPPDLVDLLDAAPDVVVPAVLGGLRAGRYDLTHRAVLVNLVARVRTDALLPAGRRPRVARRPAVLARRTLPLARRARRDARPHARGADQLMADDTVAILRPHAEQAYADELAALAASDDRPRPPRWRLSPWAVVTYLLGGVLPDGTAISPKYVGQRRLMEIAVATLATDRALLLLGIPGTAKTWVSEHLAAAISGDSTLLVQGTAGTPEESLRYGWNYARLLAEGPTEAALVPSPVYRAMRAGSLVRVEELTRMPSEVQDALVTILSEKVLPVPELDTEVAAVQGFNLIATANDRDRGINELSSALRRRFNTVVLPLPATPEEEMAIVARRVGELGAALALPAVPTAADEIRRVVTIFRELRDGVTEDGRTSLKQPSGTLSTAEAISVVTNGLALAAHFGDGTLRATDIAGGIVGAVVRDPLHDDVAWREYLEGVVRDRDGWGDFYDACRELA